MKRNLVLLSLALLFAVSMARAKTVPFDVKSAQPLVSATGLSEVLGQVTLQVTNVPPCNAAGCTSTAGTITVTYPGVPIDNAPTGTSLPAATIVTQGITITEVIGGATLNFPASPATGLYVNGPITAGNIVDPITGQLSAEVTFSVKVFTLHSGDQVNINGVRGQILKVAGEPTAGKLLNMQLTDSPSTIAAFNPSTAVIAISEFPLKVHATLGTILSPCLPVPTPLPIITVTENFNTAFVDYGPGATSVPANHPSCPVLDPFEAFPGAPHDTLPFPLPDFGSVRPCFGATNNARVNLEMGCVNSTGVGVSCTATGAKSTLPSGITLTWPANSVPDQSSSMTGSRLNRISTSTGPGPKTYIFDTPCQGLSDGVTEQWIIGTPAVGVLTDTPVYPLSCPGAPATVSGGGPLGIALSGTPADLGEAFAQGQMSPNDPTNVLSGVAGTRPRWGDAFGVGVTTTIQVDPGDPFLLVGPCSTVLLFPFVTNNVAAGFDTGVAIANTSSDPWNAPTTTYPTSGTNMVLTVPGTPNPLPIPVAGPTVAQQGKCSLYGWAMSTPPDVGGTPPSTSGGAAPKAPIAYGTAPILSGDTWAAALSFIPGYGNFTGYIIAVCDFQFGHGFAFIQTPFPTPATGANAAEGYLALIIPDPRFNSVPITAQSRTPSPAASIGVFLLGAGENLSE
jgi:hypothetical protein